MLRFAPSPTGDMHISNLRVAILNYVVAQQKKDNFLVRINDINTQNNIEGKDTEIMMILEKFAINRDLVYHQSEHLGIHQNLALRLLKEEKAFICKCRSNKVDYTCSNQCESLTKEDYTTLKKSGEKFVIRLRKPNEDIINNDIIKGIIKTTPNEIDSFIILQNDGTPTYDFACACDDMLSNIDFIIQEEEYLKNTAKQKHIKISLGYETDTQYAHLPIVLNTYKTSSVKWLFEEGFIPDAILNYLLLLGDTKAPKEIFTLPEAIEWFNLDNISKSAIKFDIDKLRFINREHIRLMDDKQLSTLFGFADNDIGKLAKVYLEEANTIKELREKIIPIFKPKSFDGEHGKEMNIIKDIIADAPAFETFNELTKHIMEKSELKDENLIKPLRVLLTGANNSPQLSEIYPFIKSYILEVAS